MTDRELLEKAAKAAGYEIQIVGAGSNAYGLWYPCTIYTPTWNPLTDDGDALRLAVKLRITLKHDDPAACCAGWAKFQSAPTTAGIGPWYCKEWNKSDPNAATRRAIVHAAAAIGESK